MRYFRRRLLPAVSTSREQSLSRRKMLTATVPLLVVLAGCGASESAPASPAVPSVMFFAEGEGTSSGAVTMRSESGGVIQKDVSLPMGDAATGKPGIGSDQFKRGDSLYLSLQNKEGGGSVTCRISVNGTVVDEATSSGAYKVVTCVGKVP